MNLFYRLLIKHKGIHRFYVKMVMSKPFMAIMMLKFYFFDLPKGIINSIRFPAIAEGDRFEVTSEFQTGGIISFSAPFSDGFDNVLLKKGTILEKCTSVPGAIAFSCLPANLDEYERLAVPNETRMGSKYAGFHFVIFKKHIGKNLRKLELTELSPK